MITIQIPFLLDQDSVRLLAVEGCAALGKLLEPQDCVAHILPVIVNFSQVQLSSSAFAYLLNHIPPCLLSYELLLTKFIIFKQLASS